MCGTRKGWSKAGQNRFNDLMVRVFIDRRQNGDAFDNIMLCRMRETYGKKRPVNEQSNNDDLTGSVVVYSDLNLEYMIRQANLSNNIGGNAQQVEGETMIPAGRTIQQRREERCEI
jgi:hypothetical protein